MNFERTRDWEVVKSIATHPKVYPHIADDFSPPAEAWEPIKDDSIWYVLVKDEGELLGMWAFVPENHVCWKVHTCLLPGAWGNRARTAAHEMARWIWENTPCRRITTDVPKYNSLALYFALRAGMERYGVNPRSYQKDGILFDQILLGLSRPEGMNSCL